MLRDAAAAFAYRRKFAPQFLTMAEVLAEQRSGLPTNHQFATGIPGWEGFTGEYFAPKRPSRSPSRAPNSFSKNPFFGETHTIAEGGDNGGHHRPMLGGDTVDAPGVGGIQNRIDRFGAGMKDLHDLKESMTDREWQQSRSVGRTLATAHWAAEHEHDYSAWAFSSGSVSSTERFAPPATDCDGIYPVYGNREECPIAAPLIRPGAQVYRRSANVMEYCGESWSELLRASVELLRANVDLVEWICCTVFGRFNEMVGMLESDALQVWCEQDTDSWDEPGDLGEAGLNALVDLVNDVLGTDVEYPGRLAGACCATAHGYWPVGPVVVCTSANGNAQKVRAWLKGSDADRTCVLIDEACDLFHELTHVVGYNFGDKPHDDCTGGSSYNAENRLRWALLQRYSEDVAGAEACDARLSGSLYGSLRGQLFHKGTSWDVAFKGCHET